MGQLLAAQGVRIVRVDALCAQTQTQRRTRHTRHTHIERGQMRAEGDDETWLVLSSAQLSAAQDSS